MMKITKYEHACVVLEEQGKKLVIDPGSLTPDFGPLDAVLAVVVTHHHFDHFNSEHLLAIVQANPDVQIFGAIEVASDAQKSSLSVTAVTHGQTVTVGPFNLKFFGEKHAFIHAGFPPVPHNVGVLINDTFYTPGDSFTLPQVPVKVLGAPVDAPWLKIGETIDFIDAIKPQTCFPIHNGFLTETGQKVTDSWLNPICDKVNAQFVSLKPGESIEA